MNATSEGTILEVTVHSQLYVSNEITPNAYKKYIVGIYKQSDNVKLTDVIVNGVSATQRPGNPSVYEISVSSDASVNPARITLRTQNGSAVITMVNPEDEENPHVGYGELSNIVYELNDVDISDLDSVVNEVSFTVTASSGQPTQPYTLYIYRDYNDLGVKSVYLNKTALTAGETVNVDILEHGLCTSCTAYIN